MRPPARPIDDLASALVTALRRLGQAGDPVEASRLAARSYVAVRREEPRIAERLDGVMHHLARLETAPDHERSLPVTDDRVLDVRNDPPVRRHALIFETFDQLAVGAAFVLVNDHDPKPLYYQLSAEQGGTFSWEYDEQGPTVWRVRIGRTAPADEIATPDRGTELDMAGR
ncbi:MAG TPA: DUF2249 domain-containing protein [Candidatus Limnocylindria bacterium]|nr:DUF2249 domain-containing protein [Candidatus Limnocylindria bacterium]